LLTPPEHGGPGTAGRRLADSVAPKLHKGSTFTRRSVQLALQWSIQVIERNAR